MRQEAEYQIKNEIHKQIKALIDENKNEIKDALVTKIIKELMDNVCLSSQLKEICYTKIIDGIEQRYKDNYNLYWDLGLSEKMKELYKNKKSDYDEILLKKISGAIKEYNIENYIISNEIANIIATDDKYQENLKDFLDTRINDILDKI